MATEKLGFLGILSESRKFTNSHSRHFLALSVLFILPLSFLIITFPTLKHSITHINAPQLHSLLQFHPYNSIDFKPIILSFLYAFTLLTLFLCATATVSYSFYHGFFGRPVKFIYTIRSLSYSLLRLFVTFLCAQLMILVVFLGIGLVLCGVIKGIESLGFKVEWIGFYVVYSVVFGLWLVYLYVNWVLAPVIVVVESSWGLEPLRRSVYLVKGMRDVVVCLLFYFGVLMLFAVFAFGNWASIYSFGNSFWGSVNFVMQIVCSSTLLVVFLLRGLAANTVLYINCKAFRGEFAGEIAEEFAREYVSLPCDEENMRGVGVGIMPPVVSVVQP